MVVLLVAIFAAVVSLQIVRRKKASAKIADGIADGAVEDTTAPSSTIKMKDALATLKSAERRKGGLPL